MIESVVYAIIGLIGICTSGVLLGLFVGIAIKVAYAILGVSL